MKLILNKDGYISIPAGYKLLKMKNGDVPIDIAAFQKITKEADCIFEITIAEAPMNLYDEEGLIKGIHDALAENQGLIEVNNGETASGHKYIYSIVKTVRSLEGVLYFFRMNIEVNETIYEITGSFEEYEDIAMRDAFVWSYALKSGIAKDSDELKEKWRRDPYDEEYSDGILMNMSEEKSMDDFFPEHPLTQARKLVDAILLDSDSKIEETLKLQILPTEKIVFESPIETELRKERSTAFADKFKDKSSKLKFSATEKVNQLKGGTNELGNKMVDALEQLKAKTKEYDDEKIEAFKNASKDFMKKSTKLTGKVIKKGIEKSKVKIEEEKDFGKLQHNLIYKSLDSLEPVVNVVNEAAAALQDKTRNIKTSSIPDILYGTLGTGIGSAISFAALYGLGTTGLSAAGITSGLAAAGGTMVGGIFVLAAPLAIGAGVGVSIAHRHRQLQLKEEKERLYKEAVLKHEGIIRALEEEVDADKDRIEYLESLNVLLKKAITELKKDVDLANEEMQGI